MAINIGGMSAGGARRNRRGNRRGVINEINMTPFIDVMLVLLIIFMVSAPLLTGGVPVDLPKTGAAPLNANAQPLIITLKQNGQMYLDKDEIRDQDLLGKLAQLAKNGLEERVFIKADKKLDYGRVAQVMAMITSGGYAKVGLVTASDQQ